MGCEREARGRWRPTIRLVLTAGCLLALLGRGAVAQERPPLAPGEVVARTTPRGTSYAVYLPKRCRRKVALPLVLFVPSAHLMPEEHLAKQRIRDICDGWNEHEGGVIGCSVMLRAHNALKIRSGRADPNVLGRFPALLDRDASAVDEVFADLEGELEIQPHAIAIRGDHFAGETALGVAVRRPERFDVAISQNVAAVGLSSGGGDAVWLVLPKDVAKRAAGLTVLLSLAPMFRDAEAKLVYHAKLRDVLTRHGIERVELLGREEYQGVGGTTDPKAEARFLEVRDRARVQAKRATERDERLEAAARALDHRRLSAAVKAYLAARKLEAEHGLEPASDAVGVRVESKGRAMLEEANGLAGTRRRDLLKKVARTFRGTRIAEEAQAALNEGR